MPDPISTEPPYLTPFSSVETDKSLPAVGSIRSFIGSMQVTDLNGKVTYVSLRPCSPEKEKALNVIDKVGDVVAGGLGIAAMVTGVGIPLMPIITSAENIGSEALQNRCRLDSQKSKGYTDIARDALSTGAGIAASFIPGGSVVQVLTQSGTSYATNTATDAIAGAVTAKDIGTKTSDKPSSLLPEDIAKITTRQAEKMREASQMLRKAIGLPEPASQPDGPYAGLPSNADKNLQQGLY